MIKTAQLIEVRWHGRGGQGAVTSAELVAQAAISEGKFAQAFPSFGPERRGAPVLAFNRVDSKEPVKVRAEVRRPDVVVVLDPGLLRIVNVTSGLKKDGTLLVNTKRSFEQLISEFNITYRLATVDAASIARELLGVNIVNTTMLGALIKVTGLIEMESVIEPIKHRFGRLAEKNIAAMKRAYEETLIKEQVQIG